MNNMTADHVNENTFGMTTLQENTSSELPPPLKVVTLEELLQVTFPPRESLLHPIITTQSINMLHAWRGLGKTYMAIGIAYAVASGGQFLTWNAPNPHGVLYIDGEMPANSLQERLAKISQASDKKPLPGYFNILTPDIQEPGTMPDLSTLEGQGAIEALLTAEIKLIIVDNISCLCRTGRENDAESWIPVQAWALKQRALGRAVLFVHHSGKSGEQRGASKREDILDTVIKLKRPVDYVPSQGARFEVVFEKTRNLSGHDTDGLEAQLVTDAETELQTWICTDLAKSIFDKVVELANDGLTQTQIAEEMQINRSTANRHVRKAKEMGLITGKLTD